MRECFFPGVWGLVCQTTPLTCRLDRTYQSGIYPFNNCQTIKDESHNIYIYTVWHNWHLMILTLTLNYHLRCYVIHEESGCLPLKAGSSDVNRLISSYLMSLVEVKKDFLLISYFEMLWSYKPFLIQHFVMRRDHTNYRMHNIMYNYDKNGELCACGHVVEERTHRSIETF